MGSVGTIAAYTSFPDLPYNDSEYIGDADEEYKFFQENSNFLDLIDTMTEEEKDYFYSWSQGDFMDGQQYRGFSKMSEDDQKATRIFDKYLDQATIEKPIVVTRRATLELLGFKFSVFSMPPTLEDIQALKGSTVESLGNMSCAAAAQGLTIGSDSDKRAEYRIHIPGGTKGAGMYIGDHSINWWGGIQREFMMNRDINVKVGDVKYDKDRNVYVIDLHYVSRNKHNYS